MQNSDGQSNGLNYVPYTSKRHSRSISVTSDDFRASGSKSSAERVASPPPAKAPERNDTTPPTVTTFRRLGPRPSQPPAPSPLRPKTGEPISLSGTRTFRSLEPQPRLSLPPSPALSANGVSLPPRPPPKSVLSEPPPSDRPPSPSPAASPAFPIHPLPDLPLVQDDSRTVLPSVLESKPMPRLPSSPQPRILSPLVSTDLGNRQRTAPYRPGFQPKGVYRHRTDEFVAARNLLTNHRKGEERRIERRLEKLVDLHFPHESYPKPEASRRSSSIFDLSEFKVKNPADLLRNVMEPKPGTVAAIRAAEQVITPWQEDSSASSCPICQSSFHPLSNRKHHCRLCGRVICALPPRKPNRLRQCSLLITADRQTGRIRPIPETIDYGVSKRSSSSKPLTDPGNESQPKGIRVCCECNTIIDRKQFILEAHSTSTFTKLYEAFTRVEGEIESVLGTLEALLPAMASSPTNPEAVDLKKQLSVLFTDYDAIAKRIRALPVPTPDGSQERVQQAVWTRAVHFMQLHVGILQKIPKPPAILKNSKSSLHRSANGYESAGDPEKIEIEADSALAHSLQPLLEQEALLETFVVEANAQRKFEDVKSLKANLAEIRGEINKLVAASNVRSR